MHIAVRTLLQPLRCLSTNIFISANCKQTKKSRCSHVHVHVARVGFELCKHCVCWLIVWSLTVHTRGCADGRGEGDVSILQDVCIVDASASASAGIGVDVDVGIRVRIHVGMDIGIGVGVIGCVGAHASYPPLKGV